MTVTDVAGCAIAAAGTGLIAISALGLLRLPDAYNRANAVAKAASLGVVCVLLGVLILLPSPSTAAIIGLAVLLQLLTTPFGAYAIGRAAYRIHVPTTANTRRAYLTDRQPPPTHGRQRDHRRPGTAPPM